MKSKLFIIIILNLSFLSCKRNTPDEPKGSNIGVEIIAEDGVIEPIGVDGIIEYTFDGNSVILSDPKLLLELTISGGVTLDLDKLFETAINIEYILSKAGSKTSGNLGQLPQNLTYFDIAGGDVSGEPIFGNSMRVFRMNLGHTVKFNIESIPNTMENICMNSGNIYGEIGPNFPTSMKRLIAGGESTIGGDYGTIPGTFPVTFSIKGKNTLANYTSDVSNFSGATINQFFHTGNGEHAFDSKTVDKLLVDLSKAKWTGHKRLVLDGDHAPRTPVSNSAVIRLTSKGVTVQTN